MRGREAGEEEEIYLVSTCKKGCIMKSEWKEGRREGRREKEGGEEGRREDMGGHMSLVKLINIQHRQLLLSSRAHHPYRLFHSPHADPVRHQ